MKIFALYAIALCTLIGQDWTQDVSLPRASQAATVSQKIGLTNISLNYHRPSVKGRDLWGKLIPYGKMWRVGANENATISITHPVTFGNKEIPAGTYGIHTIPNEDKWTFILSSNHTSWGSYYYKVNEDVLRIDVSTKEVHHQEQFVIGFDALTNKSAILFLHWGKKRAEIPLSVDTHKIVFQNLQNELRSVGGFSWQGWKEAADYLSKSNYKTDIALKWIDESLKRERNHSNLLVKSRIMGNMEKNDEAKKFFKEAISIAPEKLKPRLEKQFKKYFN